MSGTPPPPPSTPPPPQPPDAGARTRRSPGLIALCVVLAVVLFAAVTTIALLLADSGGGSVADERSGAGYADAACDGVDNLPDDVDDDALGIQDPLIWEMQSVAALAAAAGHADDEYTDHLDAGMEIFEGATRLDVDVLNQGLDDLRTACE